MDYLEYVASCYIAQNPLHPKELEKKKCENCGCEYDTVFDRAIITNGAMLYDTLILECSNCGDMLSIVDEVRVIDTWEW